KVMRHTLGASLNIKHNLSSSKGPKPLQLKLLTTYIPKTSAFTLAFSTSRSEERFSRNAETDLVCRLLLEKKKKYKTKHYLINYIHLSYLLLFFSNAPPTTEIYTLSLHDALPI